MELAQSIRGEMDSDTLWAVSFKCVVKGYQYFRFDMTEGENFKVLKKTGENGIKAMKILWTDTLLSLLLTRCLT